MTEVRHGMSQGFEATSQCLGNYSNICILYKYTNIYTYTYIYTNIDACVHVYILFIEFIRIYHLAIEHMHIHSQCTYILS